jgi:riboflavin synthase
MFSGIVEEIGTVESKYSNSLTIAVQGILEGVQLGESISVNGACLTVVSLSDQSFRVDLSPETLSRTNLDHTKKGDKVNLERAIAMGQRIGGHLVQGHVDSVGVVVSLERQEAESTLIRIGAPPEVTAYVVPKGFIAVDGISLTVVDRDASSFSVAVIPYTNQNTVLGQREPGDKVNLEVDILAKYVERILANGQAGLGRLR